MGGKDGLQRENRIKELEQELSRSNEVALRLQRELAEAVAKKGAPPANLKKQQPPAEGVSQNDINKELDQELSRSNEDALRLQRELAEAVAKKGAPPANLKKQQLPAEGVRPMGKMP